MVQIVAFFFLPGILGAVPPPLCVTEPGFCGSGLVRGVPGWCAAVQFVEVDRIQGITAVDWEAFEISGDRYLAVANYQVRTRLNKIE